MSGSIGSSNTEPNGLMLLLEVAAVRVSSAATFEVDLTKITTNQSQRDSRVQSALETAEFPTATFTLGAPVPLGADAASGETSR